MNDFFHYKRITEDEQTQVSFDGNHWVYLDDLSGFFTECSFESDFYVEAVDE